MGVTSKWSFGISCLSGMKLSFNSSYAWTTHVSAQLSFLSKSGKRVPLFHLDIESRKQCPYFMKSPAIQPLLTASKTMWKSGKDSNN
jgi:hypothetical protein